MLNAQDISVLAVGLPGLRSTDDGMELKNAATGCEAIGLMRMFDFDLLLAGDEIPDTSVWTLIRRVRSAWPSQRWALIGKYVSERDEIEARTLGALFVCDAEGGCARLYELARSLLKRRAAVRSRATADAGTVLQIK